METAGLYICVLTRISISHRTLYGSTGDSSVPLIGLLYFFLCVTVHSYGNQWCMNTIEYDADLLAVIYAHNFWRVLIIYVSLPDEFFNLHLKTRVS